MSTDAESAYKNMKTLFYERREGFEHFLPPGDSFGVGFPGVGEKRGTAKCGRRSSSPSIERDDEDEIIVYRGTSQQTLRGSISEDIQSSVSNSQSQKAKQLEQLGNYITTNEALHSKPRSYTYPKSATRTSHVIDNLEPASGMGRSCLDSRMIGASETIIVEEDVCMLRYADFCTYTPERNAQKPSPKLATQKRQSTKQKDVKQNLSTQGSSKMMKSVPNIFWRSISQDELRRHRRYNELLPVPYQAKISIPQHLQYVRQDSLLWMDLHRSIVTTQKLRIILGFADPEVVAYLHLPLRSSKPRAYGEVRKWILTLEPLKFPIRYSAKASAELWSSKLTSRSGSASSMHDIRCGWGIAQEASTMYALLHFWKECEIEEVGLCLVDWEQPRLLRLLSRVNLSPRDLPPLGTSPDGRLVLGEGVERESIEIKNTCPFQQDELGAFKFEDRGPYSRVPSMYIPQIQLQMLADDAHHCNFVSSSVSKGMNIFRVRRDDDYILKMLLILASFYEDARTFPNTSPAPPTHCPHYSDFLAHTLHISMTTPIHECVPDIYRIDRDDKLFIWDENCRDTAKEV